MSADLATLPKTQPFAQKPSKPDLSRFTTMSLRRRNAFLKHLKALSGNISRACEASKLAKPTAYALREADPEFARVWQEIVDAGIEDLESEARRRAYAGIEESVFYKGEECGKVLRYSDTLMQTLLKAHKPEMYRENIKVETDLTPQSIEALGQSLASALIAAATARRLQVPQDATSEE